MFINKYVFSINGHFLKHINQMFKIYIWTMTHAKWSWHYIVLQHIFFMNLGFPLNTHHFSLWYALRRSPCGQEFRQILKYINIPTIIFNITGMTTVKIHIIFFLQITNQTIFKIGLKDLKVNLQGFKLYVSKRVGSCQCIHSWEINQSFLA